MKKFIFLLLSCFLLTGCSNNENIGIIGGTDGPTAILAGEETMGEKAPIRMLRINGELYYDTGKVSENTPRCGVPDGSLAKGADQFEIPTYDDTANFEPSNPNWFGYQRVDDKYTVEVPLDGGWTIFRKITDPEFDEDEYKYCMYLKGIMPNAASESEFIVLANDKELDFPKVTKSMYSSHSDDFIDKYVIFPNEGDLSWGIGLTAENATHVGCKLVFIQSGGYPSGELQTGDWYEIEKYDGKWFPVETLIPKSELAWHQLAYPIPKDGKREFVINWESLYGKLNPGSYRLSKEVMDFRESGDFDKRIFYAYFEIE